MSIDLDRQTDVPALLKVVGEPLRWRILQLLAREELCVCHLVEELDTAQPLISHHLRVLRDAGLVESSRLRYWTYYRLRSDALLDLGHAVTDLAEVAPSAGERRRPCC